MRNLTRPSIAILLLAWSSMANALGPPSGPDMRCLLVGMRLSTATEPQQKSAGLMLTSYFYAKLDQTPTKDLEEALAKEALDMSPSDFKFELGRCGGIFKDKAQAIKEIGADLLRRRQDAETAQPNEAKPNEK